MIRGGSRVAATSKMECFVIIVNDLQPLTIITKHSILVLAAAVDPSLVILLLVAFITLFTVYLFHNFSDLQTSLENRLILQYNQQQPIHFLWCGKHLALMRYQDLFFTESTTNIQMKICSTKMYPQLQCIILLDWSQPGHTIFMLLL